MATTTITTKAPVVTKDELVTAIASKAGMKKVDAQKAYDALLESISEQLASGRDVRLSGIGSLRTNVAPARTSRNPRTGEPVSVPSRRVVRFSASAELKGAVGQAAA